jgi:hypothetical protein
MKGMAFVFAAILCAAIMTGTVMAAANAGMTQTSTSFDVANL